MIRHLLAAAGALLVAHSCARAEPEGASLPPPRPYPVHIQAKPLTLSVDDPTRTRVGALTWAGGFQLTSADTTALGGLSGIDVAEDGVSFLSQSDEGWLFRGKLMLDGQGRLAGVSDVTVQGLVDEHGRGYRRKIDSDAEDVTLVPGGYAISYEQDHRVLLYRSRGGAGVRLPVSPDIFKRPPNNGLEALAYRDGVMFEGAEDGEIWRCGMNTGATCTSVMPTSPFKGFSLTGLDACGDGFVAVYRAVDLLHGWRAVIAYLSPAAPDGSGPWTAQKLAELSRPLTRDNMEGIAAVPLKSGGWRLYLVSDDNFKTFERTLLLALDWTTQAR